MHRAPVIIDLFLMLRYRCACRRETNSPLFFFLSQASTSSPHPGLRQAFSFPPAGFGGRRNLPLFCCCKDKHRRCGGEKKTCIFKQLASETRGEGRVKSSCVSLITKLFPGGAAAGKHFFLISFCSTSLQMKIHKNSNIIDSMLFHSVTRGALLILFTPSFHTCVLRSQMKSPHIPAVWYHLMAISSAALGVILICCSSSSLPGAWCFTSTIIPVAMHAV